MAGHLNLFRDGLQEPVECIGKGGVPDFNGVEVNIRNGFYAPGQDDVVESLQESALYKEDRLGLKAMDENNQLVFLETDGEHLQFSTEWFNANILQYLED